MDVNGKTRTDIFEFVKSGSVWEVGSSFAPKSHLVQRGKRDWNWMKIKDEKEAIGSFGRSFSVDTRLIHPIAG